MSAFDPPPDPARRTVAGISILLAQMRAALRARHYSPHTEKAYLAWVRRLVVFTGRRHPIDIGDAEVSAFLLRVTGRGRASASTQSQAASAIAFLFREVLGRSPVGIVSPWRPKPSARVPVVLTHAEIAGLLRALRESARLMVALLYGSGLRLSECCRLHVRDIDFGRRQIVVRGGKGAKDRTTLMPDRLLEPLREHLERVRVLYSRDLEDGLVRRPRPARPLRRAGGTRTMKSPLLATAAGANAGSSPAASASTGPPGSRRAPTFTRTSFSASSPRQSASPDWSNTPPVTP